jgi:hypothetical protein
MKFGINDGRQTIERGFIPAAPGLEHAGHFGRGEGPKLHHKILSQS